MGLLMGRPGGPISELNSHLMLASIAARTQDPKEKHEAEQLLRAIVQRMSQTP